MQKTCCKSLDNFLFNQCKIPLGPLNRSMLVYIKLSSLISSSKHLLLSLFMIFNSSSTTDFNKLVL